MITEGSTLYRAFRELARLARIEEKKSEAEFEKNLRRVKLEKKQSRTASELKEEMALVENEMREHWEWAKPKYRELWVAYAKYCPISKEELEGKIDNDDISIQHCNVSFSRHCNGRRSKKKPMTYPVLSELTEGGETVYKLRAHYREAIMKLHAESE